MAATTYKYAPSSAKLIRDILSSTGITPVSVNAGQFTAQVVMPDALDADMKAALDQAMLDDGYTYVAAAVNLGAIADGEFLRREGYLINSKGVATAAAISTSSVSATGSAATLAASDHTHKVSITTQQAAATTEATTDSTSDVVVTSMTLTPGAGDWVAHFSGSVEHNGLLSSDIFVSFYVDGSQVAHTERIVGGPPGDVLPVYMCSLLASVSADDAVEVRWRVSANTATMYQRSLVLQKVN